MPDNNPSKDPAKSIFSDGTMLAKIFLAISILPLAFIFTLQYAAGLTECKHLYQYIPYFITIIFSLLALINPSIKIFLLSATVIMQAFLVEAAIAFYHIGIEKHWWQGVSADQNICDASPLELAGMPVSLWNFIYALIAGIASAYITKKYIKLKAGIE